MIGDILKRLREERKLTQQQIAQILGVAINTYCNYEQGFRQIPDKLKLILADYFDVTLDYLFEREKKVCKPAEHVYFIDKFLNKKREGEIAIGDVLKNLRKERRLTQQQVAEILKVS